MPAAFWAAGGAAVVAILAAVADRRTRLRSDLDRVGAVDWRTIQVAAIAAVLLSISIALNAR
jgi:hypothetical protein